MKCFCFLIKDLKNECRHRGKTRIIIPILRFAISVSRKGGTVEERSGKKGKRAHGWQLESPRGAAATVYCTVEGKDTVEMPCPLFTPFSNPTQSQRFVERGSCWGVMSIIYTITQSGREEGAVEVPCPLFSPFSNIPQRWRDGAVEVPCPLFTPFSNITQRWRERGSCWVGCIKFSFFSKI